MFLGNFYENGYLYWFVVCNLQTKICGKLQFYLILHLHVNVLYKQYELPAPATFILCTHEWSLGLVTVSRPSSLQTGSRQWRKQSSVSAKLKNSECSQATHPPKISPTSSVFLHPSYFAFISSYLAKSIQHRHRKKSRINSKYQYSQLI